MHACTAWVRLSLLQRRCVIPVRAVKPHERTQMMKHSFEDVRQPRLNVRLLGVPNGYDLLLHVRANSSYKVEKDVLPNCASKLNPLEVIA